MHFEVVMLDLPSTELQHGRLLRCEFLWQSGAGILDRNSLDYPEVHFQCCGECVHQFTDLSLVPPRRALIVVTHLAEPNYPANEVWERLGIGFEAVAQRAAYRSRFGEPL